MTNQFFVDNFKKKVPLDKISVSKENLGTIPGFLFTSYWVPRTLKTLSLHDCSIKSISNEITMLSVLKNLNLSKNQLQEIPDFFSELHSLKSIDFSSNQISEIPEFFTNLTKLKLLNVIDNPLETIPNCILHHSANFIHHNVNLTAK